MYESTDSANTNEGEGINQLPAEYLRSLDIARLPPPKLQLGIGAPIMLLRNLLPQEGFRNGTRMVVTNLPTSTLN